MTYEKIIKIITLVIFLSISSLVKAEQKTVYIDIDSIMKNSLAGKSISKQLEKINQSNLINFKKSEDDLRSEEKQIVSQKNVLSETEYSKKVSLLREKISDYNENKKKIVNSLNKKQITAQASLINSLTPILADYSKENSITMIISKKNIIMGKNELDITKDILKIVDNKIKKIDLN